MNMFKSWLPAFVWMAIIFYLSHQPAYESTQLSSGLVMFLINLSSSFFHLPNEYFELVSFMVRKLAHFFTYFILGYLVIRALNKNANLSLKLLYTAFLICFCYAISDEIHQLFVLGR